jgi:DNA polymerase III sliding clamp (beta) subunit (PCNA family)
MSTRFKVAPKSLIPELQYVQSAFSAKMIQDQRQRLPLAVEVKGNSLILQADDRKSLLTSKVAVERLPGDADVAAVLHGDLVVDYLKLVSSKSIDVTVGERNTSFTHDDGSLTVPHLLIPPILRCPDDLPLSVGVSLPREDMQRLLDATSFAAIKNWNQYVSGTLLEMGAGRTRIVATNQTHLATAELPDAKGADDLYSIIIPPDGLDRLKALLRDQTDRVGLEIRGNLFVGRCGDRTFAISAAGGAFPSQWEKVLPTNHVCRLDAAKDVLLDAVKRALLMTDKATNIKLTLSKEGARVSGDIGSELVPAFSASDPVELRLDGRVLADAITACPSERVEMTASPQSRVLLILPVEGGIVTKALVSARNDNGKVG